MIAIATSTTHPAIHPARRLAGRLQRSPGEAPRLRREPWRILVEYDLGDEWEPAVRLIASVPPATWGDIALGAALARVDRATAGSAQEPRLRAICRYGDAKRHLLAALTVVRRHGGTCRPEDVADLLVLTGDGLEAARRRAWRAYLRIAS